MPPSGVWSSVAACFSIWLVFTIYKRYNHIRNLRFLPGPPTVSYLWGDTIDLRQSPVGTKYREWRRKYGTTYIIREPLMEPILVLGDTKGAAHVLNNISIYWRPAVDKSILRLCFGESVLTSDADSHARRRKRLNPAFTPQSVMKVSPTFFELAHRLKAEWDDQLGPEESTVINISEALHKLSMDAISMTMFAHNLSATSGSDSIASLLDNITNGPDASEDTTLNRLATVIIGAFPRLLNLPNPMKRWADMLRTELGKIAQEVWDEAERNEVVGGMDARVLEVLSQAKGQERASRDEAVAEIIGLLFAGSETVANVMGEFLHELAHRPVVQTQFRDELLAFEALHGRAPEFSDLISPEKAGLSYLEAVTLETMRTKAVLMDIAREVVQEDVIPLARPIPSSGQTSIRVHPGQLISVPVRDGVNVDPLVWGADAEVFRPERWFEDGIGVHGVGPSGMLTFGDGGKVCIGRAFALAEFKIVASTLVRHFSFHPAEGETEIDFYHLGGNTVKPKVRGKEKDGVKLPLCVRRVST